MWNTDRDILVPVVVPRCSTDLGSRSAKPHKSNSRVSSGWLDSSYAEAIFSFGRWETELAWWYDKSGVIDNWNCHATWWTRNRNGGPEDDTNEWRRFINRHRIRRCQIHVSSVLLSNGSTLHFELWCQDNMQITHCLHAEARQIQRCTVESFPRL